MSVYLAAAPNPIVTRDGDLNGLSKKLAHSMSAAASMAFVELPSKCLPNDSFASPEELLINVTPETFVGTRKSHHRLAPVTAHPRESSATTKAGQALEHAVDSTRRTC
jgi:hypothetical protein